MKRRSQNEFSPKSRYRYAEMIGDSTRVYYRVLTMYDPSTVCVIDLMQDSVGLYMFLLPLTELHGHWFPSLREKKGLVNRWPKAYTSEVYQCRNPGCLAPSDFKHLLGYGGMQDPHPIARLPGKYNRVLNRTGSLDRPGTSVPCPIIQVQHHIISIAHMTRCRTSRALLSHLRFQWHTACRPVRSWCSKQVHGDPCAR